MKPKLLLAGTLLLLPLLLLACGGGSDGAKSTPSASDATFRAAQNDAEKTPVDDSVRAYAKQLCQPVKSFLDDAGGTLDQLENQPTAEGTVSLDDAFTQGFALFGELKEPIENFRDALSDVDPPDELRSYHQALLDELDYALDAVDAISKNGFLGALTLPTQEATPQEPAGFEAALLQACGEDLQPFFDEFGSDFLGSGSSDATATPPPPGSVGEAVRAGDFELTVNSFTDPYTSTDEFLQPGAGMRWVLLDVSIKNVSDKSQDYGTFDFKLSDSDDFSYDSTFVNRPRELDFGSLNPGETIRGELGFALPADSLPDRLIYDPGFFGEGRIDINLR